MSLARGELIFPSRTSLRASSANRSGCVLSGDGQDRYSPDRHGCQAGCTVFSRVNSRLKFLFDFEILPQRRSGVISLSRSSPSIERSSGTHALRRAEFGERSSMACSAFWVSSKWLFLQSLWCLGCTIGCTQCGPHTEKMQDVRLKPHSPP